MKNSPARRPHLVHAHMPLRARGLYVLIVDQLDDALHLGCQILEAQPPQPPVVLARLGACPRELLPATDSTKGPAQIALFEVPSAHANAALKRLPSELSRARLARGSLVLLMLPATALAQFDAARLEQWSVQMRHWLAARHCTLLLLCHGTAPALHRDLLTLSERLSGLAQLYRSEDCIRYQLHFWHSDRGVVAARAFKLSRDATGFTLLDDGKVSAQDTVADDQRGYLAQRSVLEGAPPLSEYWKLYDSQHELLERAASARAASVLIAIDHLGQVEKLAQELSKLRRKCGNALKIVLREMAPCLRYRDERLLHDSGANLIVPYGTQLSRFLTLLESVQGQIWQHTLPEDFDRALQSLQPPPFCGLLSPLDFIAALEGVCADTDQVSLSHQLLRLQPHSGLPVEHALRQVRPSREGDIMCVVDGAIYLFLFACRSDGVEPALKRICRVPWRDLFADCERLSGLSDLPHEAFLSAPPAPMSPESSGEPRPAETGSYSALRPVQVPLSLQECNA